MKLLIISAIWPSTAHSTRAANIVIYEMLHALAKNRKGVQVGLLVVKDRADNERSQFEGIEDLRSAGIDILDEIQLQQTKSKSILRRIFSIPKIADKYPQYNQKNKIENEVMKWGADAVLIPWSEWLTHTCSELPVIKFAYYGNPDPKSALAQLALTKAYENPSIATYLFQLLKIHIFEYLHIRAMKKYELLGNVAKNDAEYYASKGHPNSFYIQNIWVAPDAMNVSLAHPENKGTPIKIIANIGKLGGTANTYGLLYLGNEILPLLEERLSEVNYEIHILGAGKPKGYVLNALQSPKIIWRGFVDDIDAEIASADVFLCVNNATEYKVGHTRYLHAWTLRAPVVAHKDASLSMPEILHMENALLGSSPEGIVNEIVHLLENEHLRKKISGGGERAFIEKFQSEKVAIQIIDKLLSVKSKRIE